MFKLITSTGKEYTYLTLNQAVSSARILFTTQQTDSEIFYNDRLVYNNLGRQVFEETWNNLLLIGK